MCDTLYEKYLLGRNDAKAETPVLWPPHAKNWLPGKDSDAGRHWGQEEKGTTEDEMAKWHHWLDGCKSGWTRGVGDEQGGLACCDSWGCKELDTTERLIWSDLIYLRPTFWSVNTAYDCYLSYNPTNYVPARFDIYCLILFLFLIQWSRSQSPIKQVRKLETQRGRRKIPVDSGNE